MKAEIGILFLAMVGNWAHADHGKVVNLTDGGRVTLGDTTVTCSAGAGSTGYVTYTCGSQSGWTLTGKTSTGDSFRREINTFGAYWDFDDICNTDQASTLNARKARLAGPQSFWICSNNSWDVFIDNYVISPDGELNRISHESWGRGKRCAAEAIRRNSAP